MKVERTKNATRNIVTGAILKIYQMLGPFIMRSVIIYFLGFKYLGLNSLFTSVLQVLNLAELGVGSAMVYSMYKPITQDDSKTICALMRLYRTYYRMIGLIIAVIGCCLLPFIPKLIHGDVPLDINVYILYLMNLLATVLTYWLFAYKNSLLQAHQRIDVTSKVSLFIETVKYALQLLVLWLTRNYYFYVLVILVCQAASNILTAAIVNKIYPDYHPIGKLDKSEINTINKRIKDLFTSKLGSVVLNSADTIVISAFLGLEMLAIYQNYYFIVTSIIAFVAVFFDSCIAGIGNSLITETREKNFDDLKKFSLMISWIAGVCVCCFLSMFQPFMTIWMGKDNLLSFAVVVCLAVYFYIYEINKLLNTYKDAAGLWHADRWRPFVTAIVNLCMNLIMVRFIGIYGVLLSTVFSLLLVGMPWLFHNVFTLLFDMKDIKGFLAHLFFYVCITAVCAVACVMLCSLIHTGVWTKLIISGLIAMVVPNVVFWAVYHKMPEYKACLQIVERITMRKLELVKK